MLGSKFIIVLAAANQRAETGNEATRPVTRTDKGLGQLVVPQHPPRAMYRFSLKENIIVKHQDHILPQNWWAKSLKKRLSLSTWVSLSSSSPSCTLGTQILPLAILLQRLAISAFKILCYIIHAICSHSITR